MAWTDAPKLTSQEEQDRKFDALSPRDMALLLTVSTLTAVAYEADQNKPAESHFKDLSFAMAKTLKHTATMDTVDLFMKVILRAQETLPPNVSRADFVALILKTLKTARALGAQKAEEATTDTMRLIALLPNAERFGASK